MTLCAKLNESIRKLMYPKGATPLSYSILLVVFSVTFFSAWIITMVLSFCPKLVRWFGISGTEVGIDVGIIATSGSIGSFISNPIWGWLSDKKGRRLCVLATSVSCIVTTIMFGFSQSLWWAVGTRFIQGLSLGQVVVLKGILREVCDKTNMAVGMSVLLTAFNVGNIIGPSLGGFTAFPTNHGLFARFPALLPNIIAAAGNGVGIILVIILLRKDDQQNRNKADGEEDKRALLDHQISYETSDDNIDVLYKINKNKSFFTSRLSQFIYDSDLIAVLRSKECLFCCVLFVLFATVDIGFEVMFPIIASTDPKLKGMGFKPSDVGVVLMIVSLIQVIFQLTLLPKLSAYVGPKKTLVISNVIQAIFCPLIPALALVNNEAVMWVGLIVVIFFVRTCVFTGYLALNIIINNSVEIDMIGSANGVTMTASYLGRLLAPIMCGGIYSWSLHNVKGVHGNKGELGFPFDQFLSFFFMSLLSTLCAIVTVMLPTTRTNVVE